MEKTDTEVERLKQRISEAKAKGPRWASSELRAEVAAWSAKAPGSQEQQAKQLGLGVSTLGRWRALQGAVPRKAGACGKLLRVKVVDGAKSRSAFSAASEGELTLELPGGAAVKGLSLGEVATLVRELGS